MQHIHTFGWRGWAEGRADIEACAGRGDGGSWAALEPAIAVEGLALAAILQALCSDGKYVVIGQDPAVQVGEVHDVIAVAVGVVISNEAIHLDARCRVRGS